MSAAVGYARSQPGVSVISMSFGQNDFSGETSFDSLFTCRLCRNDYALAA